MHASVLFHMSVSWLWEVGWVWFNTDPTDYWYWCQDWWDRYRTVPNCEKVSAHATDVHTRRDVHNLANVFVLIWTCFYFSFPSVCDWCVRLNSSGHSQSGQTDCLIGCRWPSVPASQVLLLLERYRQNVSLSLTGEDHPVPGGQSVTHSYFNPAFWIRFL